MPARRRSAGTSLGASSETPKHQGDYSPSSQVRTNSLVLGLRGLPAVTVTASRCGPWPEAFVSGPP